MKPAIVNTITNVVAVILVIFEPAWTYLSGSTFDTKIFIACILGGVVAYLTGKTGLFLQK